MSVDGAPRSTASPLEDTQHSTKLCGSCGRSFTKVAHLLRHARSHVNEKPFSCPVCGKAFARTDALQRHERTLHPAKRQRVGDSYSRNSFDHDIGVTEGFDSPPDPFGVNSAITESNPRNDPHGVHLSTDSVAGDQFLSIEPPPPVAVTLPRASQPSFPAVVQTNVPSTPLDLDDLFREWLDHDGGAPAAENALAFVLSDPTQSLRTTSNIGDHHFSLQNTFSFDEWPFGSRATANQTPSHWLQADDVQMRPGLRDSALNSGMRTATSRNPEPAQMPPSGNNVPGSGSTPLTADTWESGILHPPTSMTQSIEPPLRSRITSPEQVVGELDLDAPEVRMLQTSRRAFQTNQAGFEQQIHRISHTLDEIPRLVPASLLSRFPSLVPDHPQADVSSRPHRSITALEYV